MTVTKMIHLGTEKIDCGVIVEVLLQPDDKKYFYKTSMFFYEKFLSLYRKPKCNMKSFNYLKENSKLTNKEGIL